VEFTANSYIFLKFSPLNVEFTAKIVFIFIPNVEFTAKANFYPTKRGIHIDKSTL